MVLVSHGKKYIYIKNYKVGGTSVEVFFEKWCQNKNDIIGVRCGKKERKEKTTWHHLGSHTYIRSVLNIIGKEKYDKYLKFCVVRNPYDKMVSAYFFKVGGGSFKGTFKEFCKSDSKAYNLNRYSINKVPQCDVYIRYENLTDDIKKLCKMLNINSSVKLPNYKGQYRPKDKHYSHYYDKETKKIVYNKHKKEFLMFGYKFEKG